MADNHYDEIDEYEIAHLRELWEKAGRPPIPIRLEDVPVEDVEAGWDDAIERRHEAAEARMLEQQGEIARAEAGYLRERG